MSEKDYLFRTLPEDSGVGVKHYAEGLKDYNYNRPKSSDPRVRAQSIRISLRLTEIAGDTLPSLDQELKRSITDLKTQTQELINNINEINNKGGSSSDATALEVSGLKSENNRLTVELSELKEDYDRETERLKNEVFRIAEEKGTLVEELQTERELVRSKDVQIDNITKTLQLAKTEREAAQNMFLDKEEEIEELKNEIEALKEQIVELQAQINDGEEAPEGEEDTSEPENNTPPKKEKEKEKEPEPMPKPKPEPEPEPEEEEGEEEIDPIAGLDFTGEASTGKFVLQTRLLPESAIPLPKDRSVIDKIVTENALKAYATLAYHTVSPSKRGDLSVFQKPASLGTTPKEILTNSKFWMKQVNDGDFLYQWELSPMTLPLFLDQEKNKLVSRDNLMSGVIESVKQMRTALAEYDTSVARVSVITPGSGKKKGSYNKAGDLWQVVDLVLQALQKIDLRVQYFLEMQQKFGTTGLKPKIEANFQSCILQIKGVLILYFIILEQVLDLDFKIAAYKVNWEAAITKPAGESAMTTALNSKEFKSKLDFVTFMKSKGIKAMIGDDYHDNIFSIDASGFEDEGVNLSEISLSEEISLNEEISELSWE